MTRRTIELIILFAALLLAAMAFHAWLAAHDEQQRLQATLAAQKQLLDAADARERDRNAALNQTLASIAKLKSDTRTPEEILRELPQYLPLPQPITLGTSAALTSQPIGNAPGSSSPSRAIASAQQGTPPDGPSVENYPTAPRGAASSSASTSSTSATSSASAAPTSDVAATLAELFPASQARAPQPAAPPSDGNMSLQQGTSSSTLAAPSTSSISSASQALPSAPVATIPAADLAPLFDFVQDCRACQAKLAVAQQNASDDATKITALTRERDAAITASKGGTFWRRLRRNALWFAIGAGAGLALAKH